MLTDTARHRLTGILFAVLATVLFGLGFGLAAALTPFTPIEVTGWRVIVLALLLVGLSTARRSWPAILTLLRAVRQRPLLLLIAALQAVLLGLQFWIFVGAPRSEEAVPVTLGYFLLPLTMVLAGRFFHRDRNSGWQRAAIISAAIGVGFALVTGGSLSLMTALVALGYPAYFLLRRRSGINGLPGLFLEMLLLTPAALIAISTGTLSPALIVTHPELLLLLLSVALLGGIAMIAYLSASERLPLGLFGLIGYLEPVLLLLVTVLLGRALTVHDAFTFTPIALALVLLGIEGTLGTVRAYRRSALAFRGAVSRRQHPSLSASAANAKASPESRTTQPLTVLPASG